MHLEYLAYNGKNRVWAGTAAEATAKFLATFKNRSFNIAEYRDGRHFFQFGGSNSDEDNCLRIAFKNRTEAMDFANQAKAAA